MFPPPELDALNNPFAPSATPSPSPSMDSETYSMEDSDWSTDSSWSFDSYSSSPCLNSPVTSLPIPPPPAGNTVPDVAFAFPDLLTTGPQLSPALDLAQLFGVSPSLMSQLSQAFPCHAPSPSRRRRPGPPRPPNAFMLFRSDLLKSGKIPSRVERRQQNISRVAGECWNLMSDEEKEKWFQKARDALEEHKRLHPEYKFSPSPKAPRKSRASAHAAEDEGKDHIRKLREQWTGMLGPAVPPVRPRKCKARPMHKATDSSSESATELTRPSSTASHVASSSSSMSPSIPSSSAPMLDPYDLTSSLLDAMSPSPKPSSSHTRRSRHSTSARPTLKEHDKTSSKYQDNDLTPTAFNFGHIPMPPKPKANFSTHYDQSFGFAPYAGSSQPFGDFLLPQQGSSSSWREFSQIPAFPDLSLDVKVAEAPAGDLDYSVFGSFEPMFGDPNAFSIERELPEDYFLDSSAVFGQLPRK
ncbi:hypothetical protein B0H21DRAFT_189098 [Amylocystis lapponica]|nr:hypothetical protein B0H21DRAFT_189098 [Amylocystis lapponica]